MATSFVDGRALFLHKKLKKNCWLWLVGEEHYQFCWWERILCQQIGPIFVCGRDHNAKVKQSSHVIITVSILGFS
jgi:hypothetical protein